MFELNLPRDKVLISSMIDLFYNNCYLTDIADDYDDEIEAEATDMTGELSLAAMLQNGEDDDYYDYEEY